MTYMASSSPTSFSQVSSLLQVSGKARELKYSYVNKELKTLLKRGIAKEDFSEIHKYIEDMIVKTKKDSTGSNKS